MGRIDSEEFRTKEMTIKWTVVKVRAVWGLKDALPDRG
jgi:hypothetical protein